MVILTLLMGAIEYFAHASIQVTCIDVMHTRHYNHMDCDALILFLARSLPATALTLYGKRLFGFRQGRF